MLKRSWNRTCKRQLSCSEFTGASLTKTNRGECLKKAEFEFSRDRLMRSDFLRWLYELVDCSAFYGSFAEEVGSVAFRMMSSAEFIIRNSSKSYPLLWDCWTEGEELSSWFRWFRWTEPATMHPKRSRALLRRFLIELKVPNELARDGIFKTIVQMVCNHMDEADYAQDLAKETVSFSGAGVWAAATVCRSRITLHSHFKVWLNQMHIQDALNDAKRFNSRAPEVAGSD